MMHARPRIEDSTTQAKDVDRKSLRHTLGVVGKERRRCSSPLTVTGQIVDNDTPKVSAQNAKVVGHRGALYAELENTREGFMQCAEWGCHAVELDVFALKDGTVIVFHGGGTDENPGDLSEYCLHQNGRNILDCNTYTETQQLEFDPSFPEFACPPQSIEKGKIPTLEQVLIDLKPTNTHVKIELKEPGVVKPVLELVERLQMESQCSYSCFDLKQLALVRSLRPDKNRYPTGALFNDVPEDFLMRATLAGATEVHLRYDTCTQERVDAIHAAGFGSMAWFRGPVGMLSDTSTRFLDVGNEDDACYKALLDTGVQQMCCNRPDLLLRMLQENASN